MRLLATKSAAVKVLASAALVGGAASVAGLGTFGAFTSTTSAAQAVSTGKLILGQATSVRDMTIPAANMVPGDTIQRTVTLTRSDDTEAFGTVKLTTSTPTGTLLTSDTTNGLQVKVEQCTVAWVKDATTNNLTCGGTLSSVIAQRPVLGSDVLAATSGTLTALNGTGKSAYLRVTLALPDTAGNTFQGLTNNISFTFDATQRTRTSFHPPAFPGVRDEQHRRCPTPGRRARQGEGRGSRRTTLRTAPRRAPDEQPGHGRVPGGLPRAGRRPARVRLPHGHHAHRQHVAGDQPGRHGGDRAEAGRRPPGR